MNHRSLATGIARLVPALCAAVLGATSLPQPAIAEAGGSHELDGRWSVELVNPSGAMRSAQLEIGGQAGSWHALVQSKNNACFGQRAPVSLRPDGAGRATATIEFSKALSGCADATLSLERVSAQQWRGTHEAVAGLPTLALTMTRE